MIVIYRGIVYPAQCDAMGHMNTQHYVGAFDQASWQLLFMLGYGPSWIASRREGWVDVRHEISYMRELIAGAAFYIQSGIVKLGEKSLVTFNRMVNTETGVVCAELTGTTVFFDLAARKAKPIPAVMREAAERLMYEPENPSASDITAAIEASEET